MIRTFVTSCHPEADGKVPQNGEVGWNFTVPLEGGDDYLELKMGSRARASLKMMLDQEDEDFPEEGIDEGEEDVTIAWLKSMGWVHKHVRSTLRPITTLEHPICDNIKCVVCGIELSLYIGGVFVKGDPTKNDIRDLCQIFGITCDTF